MVQGWEWGESGKVVLEVWTTSSRELFPTSKVCIYPSFSALLKINTFEYRNRRPSLSIQIVWVIVECCLPGTLLGSDEVTYFPGFRQCDYPSFPQLVQQVENDQEWVVITCSDCQEALVILIHSGWQGKAKARGTLTNRFSAVSFFKDSGLQHHKQTYS